ncbi:MAG: TIGR03088 family PEP-CTERM/XrtA system glycosyltransferase [Azoarcus sp.]|jgi:sugar transferase (PEP-CTERM/EpsH1 system associated)|nr:TIGR03088 family PEP-CTERM/XrtA system glycosyltransferase [Azoarcus sp.]
MNRPATPRLRVLHVVHGFGIGGLENMLVQLINRLPADEFEHVVLALTTIGASRARVSRPDVRFVALDKPLGHAWRLYPRILRLLRELRPDVAHTCNLAALEIAPLLRLAGVARYVHAEHGWEMADRAGDNARARWLRRLYRWFPHQQVAVSAEIRDYLLHEIGVPAAKVTLIPNGVDLDAFAPRRVGEALVVPGCPFEPGRHWLVGTVGRLAAEKNQASLVRAFARAVKSGAPRAADMRLALVGEGALRDELEALLRREGVRELAWLAGGRDDVAAILRALDCFALPSWVEGTSCTLQEAMATGLPVVATAVGGTPQLVRDGDDGLLVPPDDDAALAAALLACAADPDRAKAMGARARERMRCDFDIAVAIERYRALFSPDEASPRSPLAVGEGQNERP